ncbi:MAG: DUF3795 domain-containing protein [Synergistaceae bacterium]|nr:DUF3795 domain-containing protein [Proteiniphilum sp.]MDD3963172.1 DUF3795 domain-containing protein [Synergistaceae bacterium]
MKNFKRSDLSFSLCGLNCALCTMRIDEHCPGCGGGDGNQGCSIARCSTEHGGFEYCSECESYPCPKYNDIMQFDSFITHRNQILDMAKMIRLGSDAYQLELEQKSQILKYLLANFNDGRKKTFFSLAINLLDLSDSEKIMQQIKERITREMTVKENASVAVECFEAVAKEKGIILKMNKKPSKVK